MRSPLVQENKRLEIEPTANRIPDVFNVHTEKDNKHRNNFTAQTHASNLVHSSTVPYLPHRLYLHYLGIDIQQQVFL
jgi:hypothetical protein